MQSLLISNAVALLALVSGLVGVLTLPVGAQEEVEGPATTVTDWLAQIEASLVQITRVRVEERETGLQVVLETADSSLAVPETRVVDNALIADIPNAAIAQRSAQGAIAEEFSQADLTAGSVS